MDVVPKRGKLGARLGWHTRFDREALRVGAVRVERAREVEAVKRRRVDGGLKVHSVVDHVQEELERRLADGPPPPGNTTLTVVATDLHLGARELRQLGRQVHTSMARAIQPFHTLEDGDVLFACLTNAVDDASLSPSILGAIASELAWDAVLSCCAAGGP